MRSTSTVRFLEKQCIWMAFALGLLIPPASFAFPTNTPFITDASLTLHPRLYYINRHFDTPSLQESLAIGGWVDLKTGEWMGLSFGLTPYTSQWLAGDEEDDGGGLLQEGQEGYSVLGQAYVKWSGWDSHITLYRQLIDTPFLSSFDVKMVPVTFEAYTLVNQSISNLTVTLSQVEHIKPWTATSFQSFSEAAGLDGSDDGMTLAGLLWEPESITLQLWNYWAYNIVNSIYAQADWTGADSGGPVWSLSAQGMHQHDVGSSQAGEIQAGMGGLLGGVVWKGLTLNLGGTVTDNNTDIYNPWASYPGYGSLMEEDNDVAGEKAWVAGLAYDFAEIGLKDLSAYAWHSEAWTPALGSFSDPEQHEWDLTIDYKPGGIWEGFWIRGRAAYVDNSLSTDGVDYEDLRLIVNYERNW
jgi:outer membrane porin, OprD family